MKKKTIPNKTIIIENVFKTMDSTEEYFEYIKNNPDEILQHFYCPNTIEDKDGYEFELFCTAEENGEIVRYYKSKTKV
jgi:hypothetical protein